MKKSELVAQVATVADLSQAAAGRALDAALAIIKATLHANGEVNLTGFGKFYVDERPAYTGRNPRTGKPISIAAAKQPKFRAGKGFKDAVNY